MVISIKLKGDTMKLVATIMVFVVLLFSLFLAGCGTKCDRPYKLIDDVCCTDENQNNVCDIEELEMEEEEIFEMEEASYDDEPTIDIPDPVLKEPSAVTEPEEKILYKAPAKEDVEEAEPVIDTSFDLKKTGIAPEGMKEAKPEFDTRMTFTVDNVVTSTGYLHRADFTVTNNMDVKVTPRINIYGMRDGDFRKIDSILFKPLSPGKTVTNEGEHISVEIEPEERDIKWEFAYYSSRTGLVVVGSEDMVLD